MKNFKLITFYIIFLIVGCEDTNQNDENKNEIIDEQPTIPCLKANLDCQRTIELTDEQTFTFDLFSTHPLDSVMLVKNAIIFSILGKCVLLASFVTSVSITAKELCLVALELGWELFPYLHPK